MFYLLIIIIGINSFTDVDDHCCEVNDRTILEVKRKKKESTHLVEVETFDVEPSQHHINLRF